MNIESDSGNSTQLQKNWVNAVSYCAESYQKLQKPNILQKVALKIW